MAAITLELDDDERKVLRALASGGTMSPGKISAETRILPAKALALLKRLSGLGLVVMRENVGETADGMLVMLTAQARDLLNLDTLPPTTKR